MDGSASPGSDDQGDDSDDDQTCGGTYADRDRNAANGCEAALPSDPKNCGACGNKCKSNEVCNDGNCGGSCDVGRTNCFRACIDVNTDRDNCGACGKACGSGSTCAAGVCSVCTTTKTDLTRTPLYMEFVVDASGSMAGDKWTTQIAALKQVFGEYYAEADKSFGAGLIVFGESVSYPRFGKDIPLNYVDSVQLAAINGLLDKSAPNGSTPTKEALEGAYSVLTSFSPPSPLKANGKKVVLLVSDGLPNDETGISTLITNAFASSAPIYSLAIGVDVASDKDAVAFMAMVAKNGGTSPTGCAADSAGANACFLPVANLTTADFVNTLHAARNAVACEYSLAGISTGTSATVSIKDSLGQSTVVAHSETDGWWFDSSTAPTKLFIRGKSCAAALAGTVSIGTGCN